MDDAAAVRQLQRVAERRHDAPDVVHLQPAALGDLVLEAWPVQQLHDEKRRAGRIDVEVEDADDVGMAQACGGAALAHEPVSNRRGRVVGANHLDGDFVAEQDAAGAVDRAHGAGRDEREDLVASVENLTRGEHAAFYFRLNAEATRVLLEDSRGFRLQGKSSHRWIRADPPFAKARTWSTVAIVVSPGNVAMSAPCAQPSLTESSGVSPLSSP